MFLRQLDLTTALRPSLLPDETLLFVQDSVGLYEGKYKIPKHWNMYSMNTLKWTMPTLFNELPSELLHIDDKAKRKILLKKHFMAITMSE